MTRHPLPGVVALLIVLTVMLTWPQALHLGTQISAHDDSLLSVWRLSWIAHALTGDPRHFFDGNIYRLGDRRLDSAGMIRMLEQWVTRWPIVSVEDGLAENDWRHWTALHEALGSRIQIVGDDLLCTNPVRIQQAIELTSVLYQQPRG